MQLSLMVVQQLQFDGVQVKMVGSGDDFNKIDVERKEKSGSNCNENVEQYLVNSTLHGLRYVGDRKISYFERIFFGLSFIFVIILSAYFISNVWQKWSASPMIISLNSKSTSISDIPFPAVTICNMNSGKQSEVKNFVKGSFNEFLLEGLCNKRDNLTSNDFSSNWPQFRQFIVNVSQSCREMFLLCKFASSVEHCMNLFDTALTDEGLCCTFNQVHRKYLVVNYNINDEWDVDDEELHLQPTDWTPETGYVDSVKDFRRIFPRPAPGPGIHMGLTVVLNAHIDDYHCSTTDSKGFKVLLHSPTETPQIQNFGFSITPGYESRVVITPRIADANNKIRSIIQSQRNCVFASEGNLAYFRTYSRKNCELECKANLIYNVCGCVLYYMPRTSNETSICNRDDYDCYSAMMRAIDLKQNDTFTCNCIPGCFELSYSGEISNAHLGSEKFHTKNNIIKAFGEKFSQRNVAMMHIYYEQKFFRSSTKEELIGFTEFLSNTGGLLGLFLGFSVVSLIEILYFLTCRPYCAQRRQKEIEISTKKPRRKRTVDLAEKPRHNKFIGQINNKELDLFRPEIFVPVNNSHKMNRYQYFE